MEPLLNLFQVAHCVESTLKEGEVGLAEGGEHEVVDLEANVVRLVQVAVHTKGVEAALIPEVALLAAFSLELGFCGVGSVLGVLEGSRRRALNGNFASLAGWRRVMKGQRREVLGDGAVAAKEMLQDRLLHLGEAQASEEAGYSFAKASEDSVEHVVQ